MCVSGVFRKNVANAKLTLVEFYACCCHINSKNKTKKTTVCFVIYEKTHLVPLANSVATRCT